MIASTDVLKSCIYNTLFCNFEMWYLCELCVLNYLELVIISSSVCTNAYVESKVRMIEWWAVILRPIFWFINQCCNPWNLVIWCYLLSFTCLHPWILVIWCYLLSFPSLQPMDSCYVMLFVVFHWFATHGFLLSDISCCLSNVCNPQILVMWCYLLSLPSLKPMDSCYML